MHRRDVLSIFIWFAILSVLIVPVWAIGEEDTEIPPATIINDEGGPVVIRGQMSYTNPLLMMGVSEPIIILEDQTGFVRRDRDYIFPIESQVMGKITSDFLSSPYDFTISLPIEPQAPLNDLDHDGQDDPGVMVYMVAFWTNIFGDAYLEERDLGGGGWSSGYASGNISSRSETIGEYTGGKLLVYAPVEGQAFPSGFGADEKLFTADDPLVLLPQGYTVVDMDTSPFAFDRSREAHIDLIEGEASEADDFSGLTYTEAFDAMVDKYRHDYAFSEYKNMDWDALHAEFRPRIEEAEANIDVEAFILALQEFTWQIPDGHLRMPLNQVTVERFTEETDGGLGIAIRELDDGRVIVNFVLEDSPAEEAGMQLGTEIIAINGVPITEALKNTRAWSEPASTDHWRTLQRLRYVIRFRLGEDVEVTFRNPDSTEDETVTMTTIAERESFAFSSFFADSTGFEQPIDFQPVGPYMLVRINSFSDDERLTVIQWERMLQQSIQSEFPAIILDMRNNGGGSGWLADQMAAYFFDEAFVLGNTGRYDEDIDGFYFDPDWEDQFILAPEQMRYRGEVVVLVGPNCASACEFFSYNMTVDDRATVIGQYPTAGAGGGVQDYFMPEGLRFRMTVSRAVDMDGNIHIEGIGVVPDIRVPVTAETLLSSGDPVLEAAIDYLNGIVGQMGQ